MPQNSIIRADGTGDYTSPIAWEAAEQNSDYGSITVGRLDGFFDNGTSILDINGSWPNGARLEPFDSGEAFDGTERQLCGITTASTSRTIRNRSLSFEMEGLEIYNTSTDSYFIFQITWTCFTLFNECTFNCPSSFEIIYLHYFTKLMLINSLSYL